jgi:hypothetical protein
MAAKMTKQNITKMKRFLQLIPVWIHRIIGRLPLQPKTGDVSFANVGEGVYDKGVRTYFADASAVNTPGVHYLLYKKSASPPSGYNAADCVTLTTGNTDLVIGSSDDAPDFAGMPTAVNLFGAEVGTCRIITDGTILDGSLVMPSSAQITTQGVATYGCCTVYVASATNVCIGRAMIPSDCTSAAGDAIQVIPMTPVAHGAI